VTGSFTFSPPPGPEWSDLKGYQYDVDSGTPVFVAAGADRRATITWAPGTSGNHLLEVFAVHADGTQSVYSNLYDFIVA